MRNAQRILAVVMILLLSAFVTADWDIFVSKEGNFRIRFPKKPTEGEKVMTGPRGDVTVKHYLYEVGKFRDDNISYDIGFVDYPDTLINTSYKIDLIEKFLDNIAAHAQKDITGNVISLEKTHYKDFPGRHLKMELEEAHTIVNMKIYLVNSRIYYLEVRCKPERAKNPSIGNFFNSFEVTRLRP